MVKLLTAGTKKDEGTWLNFFTAGTKKDEGIWLNF